MIIVLIGYMGSGKSSVGKILAKKLNYNLIDLDDFIEAKEHATVSEIFKTKGEIYFRKKETEYLKTLLQLKENTILSLGGGTPCYGNNMDVILNTEHATSIYLKGSLSFLSKKLFKKKAKRPLIAHIETETLLKDFIAKHLFERSQFYNKAQIHIVTDHKEKSEIVEDIILALF
ncbi:shikimate kinase [Jejuia pallidilutea]|uniref:Shikimate kinase n=2 Tax=Jejuia pallidilutea TaxID=504487 RepID=A0A090WMA3_9FLAO|nr:shikimate kinase [Jejuia pallidilutea]GAL68567.1 shikimate kinase I [Jejuia pallidilutea]GAL90159.1 shikimate kinase I [Jejuia pallidilutea]